MSPRCVNNIIALSAVGPISESPAFRQLSALSDRHSHTHIGPPKPPQTCYYNTIILPDSGLYYLFFLLFYLICCKCTLNPSPCLQERLLLSLLPAHIARVMKAEIIQRLQGPNFGRTESTNNFHNLYVQRHTNVR